MHVRMNRLTSLVKKTSPLFIQLAFIIGKQLIQIILTKTRGTLGKFNRGSQKLQKICTITKKIKRNTTTGVKQKKYLQPNFFKQTMLPERMFYIRMLHHKEFFSQGKRMSKKGFISSWKM
jgi:hypothetical protein